MESGDDRDDADFQLGRNRRISKRKQDLSANAAHYSPRYSRRKSKNTGEQVCPICHLTLREGEYSNHLELEWQKLSNSLSCPEMRKNFLSFMSQFLGSTVTESPSKSALTGLVSSADVNNGNVSTECPEESKSVDDSNSPGPSGLVSTDHAEDDVSSVCQDASTSKTINSIGHQTSIAKEFAKINKEEQQSFQRIRINRILRSQIKRWASREADEEDAVCPVCQESVFAQCPEDLQAHVEKCLKKSEGETESSDEEVDVEGDEYEWCGMKKIRLTSLLKSQGQLDALGTLVQKGDEEDNVEVCLSDEDEQVGYGHSQYSQDDIDKQVADDTNDWDEESASPTAENASTEPVSAETPSSENECPETCNNILKDADEGDEESEKTVLKPSNGSRGNALPPVVAGNDSLQNMKENEVVKALRMKIKELQGKQPLVCRICHGPYTAPLTSISCWHVHCEKCWLRTLGSQKLCPQCKVIVLPKNLRRIYL